MSSIVRASAATSGVPLTGIEVEKSPRPSSTADWARSLSGRPMRCASSSVATIARPARIAAVSNSRLTKRSTALSTVAADSRASISAIPSPVTEITGVLDA